MATCTRGCPAERLREWLFWHLAEGVSLIYLRWEGLLADEQRAVLAGPIERGQVILTAVPKCKQSSAFQAVMVRQVKFTESSIAAARERGCKFLLHLDDDELLYTFDPNLRIPAMLKRHVGSTRKCIHFENYEAMFPFSTRTARPFSRAGVRFRSDLQVLYCNGKSAAHLGSEGSVFCSGVHSFCMYDRTFAAPLPEYGLHDDCKGCSHPDCRIDEAAAVVLHFDCPSFEEWRNKFCARAAAPLTQADEEEAAAFPFKKQSLRVLAKAHEEGHVRKEEQVYRRWRCLPGRKEEKLADLMGAAVQARFASRVAETRAQWNCTLTGAGTGVSPEQLSPQPSKQPSQQVTQQLSLQPSQQLSSNVSQQLRPEPSQQPSGVGCAPSLQPPKQPSPWLTEHLSLLASCQPSSIDSVIG